jgi:uncharacterized protein (DUF2141 family)
MHRWGPSIAVALSLLVAAAGEGRTEVGGMLSFTVTGLRSRRGLVYAGIYADSAGFPADPSAALAYGGAAVDGSSATVVFRGLPPGYYAVAFFHDENGNGRLDTGTFGRPLEGYGFSNDARGRMGPPSFAAAAFGYSGGELELFASIVY